jgi:E3 ubiquitin-protein ligase NEDD4
MINFVVQRKHLGELLTYELIPGGSNIEVTEENKKDYVKACAKYIMTDAIKEQTESFI